MVALIDYVIHIQLNSSETYSVFAECHLSGESPTAKVSIETIRHFAQIGAQLRMFRLTPYELRNEGNNLYAAIFSEQILSHFKESLAVARYKSSGLRMLFKFDASRELHEVPWEILFDGEHFLSTHPYTPIVRYIRQSKPVFTQNIEQPLRVLFTSAEPGDLTPLELEAEEQLIRDRIQAMNGRISLEAHRNISRDHLHHVLARAQYNGRPFHVWHHCGHGMLDNDQFYLILTEANRAELVALSQLTPIIDSSPSLVMAVLNICYSGSPNGAVPRLAELNVPYVIGFCTSLLDSHGLKFARTLYDLLPEAPVEQAVGMLRSALYAESPDDPGLYWAHPILYARTTQSNPLLTSLESQPQAVPSTSQTQQGKRVLKTTSTAKEILGIGELNVGVTPPKSSGSSETIHERSADKITEIGELTVGETSAKDLFIHLFGSSEDKET